MKISAFFNNKSDLNSLKPANGSPVGCVLVIVALLVALSACASNPTGGANFVLMSENAEIEKGRELHEEMMAKTPIYQDPELQAYVERVGQKVAATSHRADIEYHFTIIDSPDINAFALPGGYVYVNRGLLMYLTSEAQLAAVLGHEIGHITARHAVRQQAASKTADFLSTALIFTTGVSALGETTGLVGGALLSGYGRDMELEADSLGAEYLFNAGYEPLAMVDVIGVLKNHEDFTKRTSNRGVAYHGLFATHPRNDTRLQEAVGKVGSLSNEQMDVVDEAVFRSETTGMLVGPSLQNIAGSSDARNRYYQNLLNYTVVFPNGWLKDETTTTVTASDPDNVASLKIEAQRIQQAKEPRLFIREDLNIPALQRTQTLSQFGLQGYTGIRPDTNERVAVVYYGPRAFIFTGSSSDEGMDEALLNSIRSFRPIARNEQAFANPVQINWIQADGRVTYADLAQQSRLTEYPVDMLRLMNGDYPAGEPKAGQWVKIAN